MSSEYSLCPQSAVYVPRVQYMSSESSSFPRVHLMSIEYSFCPQSTVYVLRVQFLFREYI